MREPRVVLYHIYPCPAIPFPSDDGLLNADRTQLLYLDDTSLFNLRGVSGYHCLGLYSHGTFHGVPPLMMQREHIVPVSSRSSGRLMRVNMTGWLIS